MSSQFSKRFRSLIWLVLAVFTSTTAYSQPRSKSERFRHEMALAKAVVAEFEEYNSTEDLVSALKRDKSPEDVAFLKRVTRRYSKVALPRLKIRHNASIGFQIEDRLFTLRGIDFETGHFELNGKKFTHVLNRPYSENWNAIETVLKTELHTSGALDWLIPNAHADPLMLLIAICVIVALLCDLLLAFDSAKNRQVTKDINKQLSKQLDDCRSQHTQLLAGNQQEVLKISKINELLAPLAMLDEKQKRLCAPHQKNESSETCKLFIQIKECLQMIQRTAAVYNGKHKNNLVVEQSENTMTRRPAHKAK